MRKIVIIAFLLFSVYLHAQDEPEIIYENAELPIEQSNVSPEAAALRALAEKQKEVDKFQDSIKKLNGRLVEAGKELQKFKNSFSDLKVEYDKLKQKQNAYDRLSDIIYKQCLLYPLEGRYNQQQINDSEQCLTMLRIWNNPQYSEVCDVYRPLLKEYGTYNTELIQLLESRTESFSKKQWNITNVIAEDFLIELKKSRYYPYYEKRNQKPWRSIIYLDGVIDELIKMLKTPSLITEASYKELIAKLKPKAQ